MTSKLIKLAEIREAPTRYRSQKKFSIGEIFINPAFVSFLREDLSYKKYLKTSQSWPPDLNEDVGLTRIYFGDSFDLNSACVLGEIIDVATKLGVQNE